MYLWQLWIPLCALLMYERFKKIQMVNFIKHKFICRFLKYSDRWNSLPNKKNKGHKNIWEYWMNDISPLDAVLLPHLHEDVLWSVGPKHGELLLGVRHTVLEGHLSPIKQYQHVCYCHEVLCPILNLLVLHGVDHLVLPPAPGQHHHLLLLEQEEQHCPCTAGCSTQVQGCRNHNW